VGLDKIRLNSFRCHASTTLSLHPKVNIFLGLNAQGKTSILEAVHFLCTGRSFKTTRWKEVLKEGEQNGEVAARVGDNLIQVKLTGAEKTHFLNRKKVLKREEWPLSVAFTTHDIQIARGTSAFRRRFLDELLILLNPNYLGLMNRYARTLLNRNSLLKKGVQDPRGFQAYTVELISNALPILQARCDLLPRLSTFARVAYNKISSSREKLAVRYKDSSMGNLTETFNQQCDEEMRLRQTIAGPHRDDLELTLDGRELARYGSEGQQRSVALAMRLAAWKLLFRKSTGAPLILFDDVMGELDSERRNKLIQLIGTRAQIFLTATEETWDKTLLPDASRFMVKDGAVEPWGA